MTLLKAEIQGLKKTINLLGKARVQYMKSGSKKEILDTIFKLENQIHDDINKGVVQE